MDANANILIIDDDVTILDGFKELLSRHGYQVDCAVDEREAIVSLRARQYQVVLTDIVLKETTGIELIPKIKEMSHETVIIMITAYSSTESAVQCFRAGAFDYLIKPIRKQDLLNAVQKGLAHKKQTQEINTLARIKETAEKSNKEKSLFLMQVSHDIHALMESAIAYTDILLKSSIDEKQAEGLNALKANSAFLRNLADNIFDIGKLETEKLQFKHEPFVLKEAIQTVSRIIYPLIQNKTIQFSYEVEPDVPRALIGDCDRLKQILLNLLSNAARFTESGEITLKVRLMTVLGKGCHIFFVVKDTGPGIPKERQMDIFKPFFQKERPSASYHQQYGLGLWICKVLVEKMGGLISLHSEIGKGSEFRFSIRFDVVEEKRKR